MSTSSAEAENKPGPQKLSAAPAENTLSREQLYLDNVISDRTYRYRPLYPNGDAPGYTNVPLFVFASIVCLSGYTLKMLFEPIDSPIRSNRYPSSASVRTFALNVSIPSRLPSRKLPKSDTRSIARVRPWV